MSLNLGNFADQLRCDLCDGFDPPLDLNVPPDYDFGLPDDFWDPAPEPADDPDFELPDWYPYLEFTDGGFIFGIHGTF